VKIPKFRAWVKAEKRMIKVCEIGYTDDEIHFVRDENYSFYLADEIKLMEFTGLTDIYSQDIYEGDIIKYKYYDDYGVHTFTEIVAYAEKRAGFGTIETTRNNNSWVISFGEVAKEIDFSSLKILGNVYENEDLLGK